MLADNAHTNTAHKEILIKAHIAHRQCSQTLILLTDNVHKHNAHRYLYCSQTMLTNTYSAHRKLF